MTLEAERQNQSTSSVLDQIEFLLKTNGWQKRLLRVITFASKSGDNWNNALTVIRPIEPSDQPLTTKTYPTLRAQVQDVTLKDLRQILDNFQKSNSLVIDKFVIQGQPNTYGWTIARHAGGNIYDYRACLACTLTTDPRLGLPIESLLDYQRPYFANPMQFVNELANLKLNDYDGVLHSIVIVVPEARASFSDMKQSGGELIISVDGVALKEKKNFKVKGEIGVQGEIQKIDLSVKQEKAIHTTSSPISSIRVWLIDDENYIYDEYFEPLNWRDGRAFRRTFSVTTVVGDSSLGQTVTDALNTGENERIEFKPYIKIKDSKIDELVLTALAFLNSQGGTIVMGVTDRLEVEGVDKEALRNAKAKQSVVKVLDEYLAELKQVINRSISGSHSIRYDLVEYENRRLIVIRVPQGKSRPYSLHGRSVYVRRGANNVQANADELRQILQPTELGLGGD